jgi:hypothetical protein
MTIKKRASELCVSDIQKFPVWKYTYADEATVDETVVAPVEDLPVFDLDNCIVGTLLQLNDGSKHWGTLSNVHLKDRRRTNQFLQLSFFLNNRKFYLARYFDVDFDRRSPAKLAEFLNLPTTAVFPISYDISGIAVGDSSIVASKVELEPTERLDEDERIRLALG